MNTEIKQIDAKNYDVILSASGELSLLIDASVEIDFNHQITVSSDGRQWVMGSNEFTTLPFPQLKAFPSEISVILIKDGEPVNGAMVPISQES